MQGCPILILEGSGQEIQGATAHEAGQGDENGLVLTILNAKSAQSCHAKYISGAGNKIAV